MYVLDGAFLIFILFVFLIWAFWRSDKNALPPKMRENEPLKPIQLERRRSAAYVPATPTAPHQQVLDGPGYVIDGDSIVIKKVEIRLFGVDAPEFNHPYGKKAKWALVALCKGQKIKAEIVAQDTHGRTVAKCYLPDGRDLSAEMVKQGLAIDWAKYSGGIYRSMEVPDARKKMWLADARQKGRMHVWKQFEARQKSAGKA